MESQIPKERRRLIAKIALQAQRLRARVPGVTLSDFIFAYFRGVAEDDLEARSPRDLAHAAITHLQFGRKRAANQPLVRVYTPTASGGGMTRHTVVDVVTDDMPFLVDSLSIVFAQQGLSVHLPVHPIIKVRRDGKGLLRSVATGDETSRIDASIVESWQHIEIDRVEDDVRCEQLRQQLERALDDVRRTYVDWPLMQARAVSLADDLRAAATTSQTREAAALLQWLTDNHFTFLAYREFKLKRSPSSDVLEPLPATSLGLFRGLAGSASAKLSGALQAEARNADPLLITKSNILSTVHRGVHLDHIGVKRFDKTGRVIGEHRFLGLFTSNVYRLRPRDIPVIRQKVAALLDRLALAAQSHDAKAVMHVLDTYPRDELFQADVDELIATVRGIVNLYDRHQVRLFMRRDRLQRFYSCLLYVPRDRYNTDVRIRIETIILKALRGTAVESQVELSDSALARVHLLVRSRPNEPQFTDTRELEAAIRAAVRTWSDHVHDALIARHGEAHGIALARRWLSAFPIAYQDDVPPSSAVDDVDELEQLRAAGDGQALRLMHATTDTNTLRLRLIRTGDAIALSDALPILEHLGLRVLTERPYRIVAAEQRPYWIQDFELAPRATNGPIDIDRIGTRFTQAYLAINRGAAENDDFNSLVLSADLSWREVSVLRAYAKYLLQTGLPFSQRYMERTLAQHANLAAQLWRLFEMQFDPSLRAREQPSQTQRQLILRELDKVAVQDEDRILRAYLSAIVATLRTNYFQSDSDTGAPKSYLSLKLDSRRLPDLPLPKPFVEIFVYSPRVEGVHLRMGQVARGGIRWSDRREDFRTEVLGLMKAQNVKNTVIVPVGAKGGFVPKLMPASGTPDDRQREGVACYRTFIRGLLDLTDNFVRNRIVPPTGVVRRDGDDPYLVVAADKGTATFSDIANGLAIEYGFWLGDAFASGGSAGYDHKKMAITARGGWECVKRHFRELGIDTQKQPFTVVGIGDMAGDVFGNGMLQSKCIRLIAAFNHQHIFIDPDPEPAQSFAERQRLFNLPRSTWADYNTKLISKGGGVFLRSAKSIPLTPAIRDVLQVEDDALTPQALIKAILRMPADLLWNGGIGTYVKANTESHSDVGDRTNDSVRIDGSELRCKVMGEGGNLGFTQRGRVEYAQRGGRINTDFIDNSAGVDCSDHEVNIKIALNTATQRGMTTSARNKLLVRMTDDVATLVLRDNYLQSQALSMAELSAAQRLPEHAHFIRSLELGNELDRTVEHLPTIEELAERQKKRVGLTRPELAVLLSYSKIALFNRLIVTDVPEDSYLSGELERYFPPILVKQHRPLLRKHRLRREIIATAITNSLVNRMGPSFALRVQEDTGADAGAIARAYTIAREAFEMRIVWQAIEALDTKVSAETQYAWMNETARLLRLITYWLIQHAGTALQIEAQVAALMPRLRQLKSLLPEVLGDLQRQRYQQARDAIRTQVPGTAGERLASEIALLQSLVSGPDIIAIERETHSELKVTADVYFRLGTALSLDWLKLQVDALTVDGRWQAIARNSLREQLQGTQRALCVQVLQQTKANAADSVGRWLEQRQTAVTHVQRIVSDLRTLPRADFATLSVAVQSLRQLTNE